MYHRLVFTKQIEIGVALTFEIGDSGADKVENKPDLIITEISFQHFQQNCLLVVKMFSGPADYERRDAEENPSAVKRQIEAVRLTE